MQRSSINCFLPSNISERNRLDPKIRNLPRYKFFKENILRFSLFQPWKEWNILQIKTNFFNFISLMYIQFSVVYKLLIFWTENFYNIHASVLHRLGFLERALFFKIFGKPQAISLYWFKTWLVLSKI